MNSADPNDLSARLRSWRMDVNLPTSFQREVWQRIAARQEGRESAFSYKLLNWISWQFARPQYAMAAVALCLFTGIGVGHVQAQEANAKRMKILETRYATSIDPMAVMR